MPELPDLQVISENLNGKYAKQQLIFLYFDNKAKINENPSRFNDVLLDQSIVGISRYGKEIRIDFSNGHYLMLHLMREGKLYDNVENVSNIVFKMVFQNDKVLVMSDYMKQAKISLDPSMPLVPDPFDDKFTLDYLTEQLKYKSKTKIKSFLIDQKQILGIGNAYADEILWQSRISPKSLCGNLPEDVINNLFQSIKFVLEKSVCEIKKISPDIISGEVRDFLVIHNQNIKKSPTGHEIQIEKIGGKKTYYTDEQKVY